MLNQELVAKATNNSNSKGGKSKGNKKNPSINERIIKEALEKGLLKMDDGGKIFVPTPNKKRTLYESYPIGQVHQISFKRSMSDILVAKYDSHKFEITLPATSTWYGTSVISLKEITDIIEEESPDATYASTYTYKVYKVSVDRAIDLIREKLPHQDLPDEVFYLLKEIIRKNWKRIEI